MTFVDGIIADITVCRCTFAWFNRSFVLKLRLRENQGWEIGNLEKTLKKRSHINCLLSAGRSNSKMSFLSGHVLL